MKIFLSHASADRAFLEREIVPLLVSAGFEPWLAATHMPSTSEWEKVIRRQLEACDWFLVVLSHDAVASEWVQTEVHWALDFRKDRFVSVVVDDCRPSDLHLRLIRHHHVDFRADPEAARRRLLAVWSVSPEQLGLVEIQFRIWPADAGPAAAESRRLVLRDSAQIGRAATAQLRLSDPSVSQFHASVTVRQRAGKNSVWLADLGSTNGVLLNSARLNAPAELRVRDRIALGHTILEVTALHGTPARLNDTTILR